MEIVWSVHCMWFLVYYAKVSDYNTPSPPLKKIMSTFWIDLQFVFCHMKFFFSIFTFILWCIFVKDARLHTSLKSWIHCSALKYWGSKTQYYFLKCLSHALLFFCQNTATFLKHMHKLKYNNCILCAVNCVNWHYEFIFVSDVDT